MITIERYSSAKFQLWNEFLLKAKNQTFLFNRNYMDYHKGRFIDFSLMVYENNNLVAMLPANIETNKTVLHSHKGLTYGGFVVDKTTRSIKTIEYLYYILKYLNLQGIQELYFKQIPAFYNIIPAEEIDYSLFLLEAENYRTDIASVINLHNKIGFQQRRYRSIKKAIGNKITIKQEDTFDIFWNKILKPNLQERFGVSPVHSVEEITDLAKNNSPHIKQYNAYLSGDIQAGATIYETETTAHAQYISASNEGRKNGALDFLFHELITKHYIQKDYFDFGIVNENDGKEINRGLLDWKEGFGGRPVAHRFFKINTANYINLKIF